MKKIDQKMIDIIEFDPLTATKEEWLRFHEFRKKRSLENNPDDPVSDNESVENSLKANVQNPETEVKTFSIIDKRENKQIGDAAYVTIRETSPSYEGTKHLAQFDIRLLRKYQNNGIGRRFLRNLYEFAKKDKKKLLVASTDNANGKAFLKRIGAQMALSGVDNRLNLEEVDWKMVEEWERDGQNRNSDVKMECYQRIPDAILDDYCKIYTEVTNQQPLGDLDIEAGAIIFTPESYRNLEKMFADLNRKWITFVTIEPTGKISGLTEIRYSPSRETFISQLLTGVQLECRGRGLGKWLKAKMLLKIRNEFPKVKIVTTGNATSNAPMLSINNRLGFKAYKETESAQITIEQLAKYLEIN
ncbi:MAG: GNAT family N-acetyltransferase [Asgard group archaeon]|nr:GNAT family N-acetyltransferase [Asgard group archaeon]